jgi:hypothetical protein
MDGGSAKNPLRERERERERESTRNLEAYFLLSVSQCKCWISFWHRYILWPDQSNKIEGFKFHFQNGTTSANTIKGIGNNCLFCFMWNGDSDPNTLHYREKAKRGYMAMHSYHIVKVYNVYKHHPFPSPQTRKKKRKKKKWEREKEKHEKMSIPEFVIYKIHLGPNHMHEGLWINQYLHTLVLNQFIKLPLLIYHIDKQNETKNWFNKILSRK